MANMTSSDRAQYERPDLSAPDRTMRVGQQTPGDRLHGRSPLVILAALAYAVAWGINGWPQALVLGVHRADGGRADDRGQPQPTRLSAQAAAGACSAARSLASVSSCVVSGCGSSTGRGIRISRAITRRWICEVPSYSCMIFASRISFSTG